MIDFPFEEPCLITALFCMLLYVIHMGVNYSSGIKKPYQNNVPKVKQHTVVFCLFFFFSWFCIDGDFFHFLQVIRYYSFVIGAYNYGEPIYGVIAAIVHSNYLLFRLVVWGGAYIIFCITAKRFKIPVYYAAVLLFAMYPITFTYARVTCSLSIYFWGASFFCAPLEQNKLAKYSGYIIGAVLIYYSNLFHNSAILMTMLTITAFLPINKKTVALFILLLPFILYFTQDMFISMADQSDNMEDIGRSKRAARFAETENKGLNLSLSTPGVFLHRSLSYLAFYIPNILIAIQYFKKKNDLPIDVIRLMKITFSTVLVSTLFYFMPFGGAVLIYRILFMTMIPITIITCKLKYLNLISDPNYNWITRTAILYAVVRILYYIYSML